MKTVAMVVALMLAGTGVAYAADTGLVSSEKPAHFDWSGPYVGAHLGYGWGNSNFVDKEYNGLAPAFPTVRWTVDSDGLLAGIQAGHNWQKNRWVYGVEGELGRLRLNSEKLQPGLDPYGDPYDASGTIGSGWYGGLSARVGYALDRTLLYTKAGVVYSGGRLGFVDSCVVPPCGKSTTNTSKRTGWGYQIGAGVEHAVTNHWTIKAEYSYFDFGTTTLSGKAVGDGFDGVAYDIQSGLSVHTVKVGVNYLF